MDKIQWQSCGHVDWMELTEPTFPNLLAGIDKAMAPGVGFRMLIGTTRQGTRLLQDDRDEALPLAEMIRLTNSQLVCIWWSLNPPSEPMDLFFCGHRRNDTEDSTPPPGEIRFAPRDNRGPSPDASDEGSAGRNDGQSSDGHQPLSSAAAAKRTTSTRTTRSGNTTKETEPTHRINWADVGESEPESSATQASVPRANLGTRVLRSCRQGERETDLKKASRTPANNSGKRNLVVMQEADEPYGSEGRPGPLRKVARQVGAIDAGIEVELDTRDGEHNLSWQLADRTILTKTVRLRLLPIRVTIMRLQPLSMQRRGGQPRIFSCWLQGLSSLSTHWRHKYIHPAEAIPPLRIHIPAMSVRMFRQPKKSDEN